MMNACLLYTSLLQVQELNDETIWKGESSAHNVLCVGYNSNTGAAIYMDPELACCLLYTSFQNHKL